MIGMVLVTHGRLASEFISALEHVVGPQQQIQAVCIGPDDDMERRRQEILSHVGEVDDGDGVVILTDMFGGTPSNLAISVLSQGKVEVIAGVNLPMLIKLASVRQTATLADVEGPGLHGAPLFDQGRRRLVEPEFTAHLPERDPGVLQDCDGLGALGLVLVAQLSGGRAHLREHRRSVSSLEFIHVFRLSFHARTSQTTATSPLHRALLATSPITCRATSSGSIGSRASSSSSLSPRWRTRTA